MKTALHNNKDFLAGLMFIGIGVAAFVAALDYPFGSTVRMGPGYFPRVLAGIIIFFGIITMLKGLRVQDAVKNVWGWRALAWITLSLVLFGWLMDRFGMIPALVAMFFCSAYAGHEFKWKEVTILTVIMTVFAIGVFVIGLGLPYPLIKGL